MHLKRMGAMLAALACLSLSAAACAAQPGPSPTSGAVAVQPTTPLASQTRLCAPDDTTDEKILFEVENAYRGTASSYLIIEQAGLLSPPVKATAKQSLGTAYSALLLARQAYAVCDAPSLFGKVGQALGLIGKVKALLPAKAR